MNTPSGYRYERFRAATGNYVMTPAKAKIVDLAIQLGRPLLVEGEAGCGKTRLAGAIAEELGLPKPTRISVKSTSRAVDLLYRFDALRRLQDSQLEKERDRARWVGNYIQLDKLGAAIHAGKPAVVLIDEIDKADIDFPNDLLDVLEDFEFDIDELPEGQEVGTHGRHVTSLGGVRPIVVVTSNREKQLPEPFLRRCLYLELTFPEDASALAEIVEINLKQRMVDISSALVKQAVTTFIEIRQTARGRRLRKLPATAELIDWIHTLHWESSIPVVSGPLPLHWDILFKTAQDLEDYARAVSATTTPEKPATSD
jgi:MoxR-like ATPase